MNRHELDAAIRTRTDEMRAVLDAAKAADRGFTDGERARLKTLEAEAEGFRTQRVKLDTQESDDKLRADMKALGDHLGAADGGLGVGSLGYGATVDGSGWAAKAAARMVEAAGPQYATMGAKALTSGVITVPSLAGLVRTAEVPTSLLDLVGVLPLEGTDSWSYLRQVARVNNAAPVQAGALKPTSVYTVEKVTKGVTTLAHLSEKIPRQTLSDAGGLEEFLRMEMEFGLREELESQIVSGNGSGTAEGQNFTGILNTSGIQAVPFSTDRIGTARNAITALEAVGITPTAFALSPQDWASIETTRGSDGHFLAPGGPVDRGAARLWGLRVVTSTAVPTGVGIVADWAGSMVLRMREDAVMEWFNSAYDAAAAATDYQRNLVQARAELRAGFGVMRGLGVARFGMTAGTS